ncbi:hypothetical protein LINPERHAP2_LOCUS42010 [Linum perenne]
MECSFSFLTIKKRLEYLWAKTRRIQVSNMVNSFFLVRFSENDDYQRAVFGAPWKIYDYYISVSRWSPAFNENEPIKKILTWVRLPKLPIHYFNHLAVNRIGNYIGRTVRMDLATEEGARGRYARLCVEVDLTKPLLGKYLIEDRELLIEYESLGNSCFSCGFYGHIDGQCSINATKLPESIQHVPVQVEDPITSGDAGSWMTVCRRNKKQAPKKVVPSGIADDLGSQFGVLSDPNEPSMEKETVVAEPRPSPKETPSSPEADALRAALEKALATDTSAVKGSSQSHPGSLPLKNVTNSLHGKPSKWKANGRGTGGKKQPTVDSNEGLISIPVAYHNPIFQVSSSQL